MLFDGTYGGGYGVAANAAARRRRRYKCIPPDGSQPHVFTEALPRLAPTLAVPAGEGATRMRSTGLEDFACPRHFQFTTREIAHALIRVGQGRSYRAAAREVRDGALRAAKDAGTATRSGNLVQDWVEVFAPIIFEPFRPAAWPDVVAVREAGFVGRSGPRQGRQLFSILTAVDPRSGAIVLLEAFPRATATTWSRFLSRLASAPTALVYDGPQPLNRVAHAVWSTRPPIVTESARAVRPAGAVLASVRTLFGSRYGRFANQERLNRLLMLMQLELDGRRDEAVYAALIRRALACSGGSAPVRHRILDRGGAGSLLAADDPRR